MAHSPLLPRHSNYKRSHLTELRLGSTTSVYLPATPPSQNAERFPLIQIRPRSSSRTRCYNRHHGLSQHRVHGKYSLIVLTSTVNKTVKQHSFPRLMYVTKTLQHILLCTHAAFCYIIFIILSYVHSSWKQKNHAANSLLRPEGDFNFKIFYLRT
jgi:hypothetical protein